MPLLHIDHFVFLSFEQSKTLFAEIIILSMKVLARFFLFLFLAFLAAPTIVILIKKSSDITVFFDFAEEEEDSQKEIKNFVHQELVNIELINVYFKEINFLFSNKTAKHDNVITFIFAPPPNLG